MLFTKLQLDAGENVVYTVRRHWFIFLEQVVLTFVFGALPLIGYVGLITFLPDTAAHIVESYFALALFLYCMWLLLLWVIFFIQWTNYYLDVWFITEKRIIDVQQKGIFHREVSNLRFDKIQDITVEVRGIIATFLKFGDLKVQTAAEDSRDFVLKSATRPEEARKVIFDMHNREGEKTHPKQNPPLPNTGNYL